MPQISATSPIADPLPPPPSVMMLPPVPAGLPPDVHAGDQFGQHGNQSIASVHSSKRQPSTFCAILNVQQACCSPSITQTKLDSHADT